MTYEIKLPQFEGPFDLLLFFIERDELDIYDIPIAKITDEFLEYLRHMKTLNIEIASEFILVAATLMRIKARTLIPRKELDEEGNEVDPREELIKRLLEYKQYKEIVESLKEMEKEQSLKLTRGNVQEEMLYIYNNYSNEAELESISLFKLLKAFQRVLQRYDDKKLKVIHTVEQFSFTIENERNRIVTSLGKKGSKSSFKEMFVECKSRIHAIFSFLALLELIQAQKIIITLGDGINNFWLSVDNS